MTVRLPPARPDTDDRDATRSSARGRVLVVDDSRATLTLISSMLRSWGYEAVAVEDPLDALALFEAGEAPFDTVLTDIQMPSMSGVELLRRVRERDRDVPIVLLTGTPSLDSAIQGIEFGAFRYLTKPLDLAKFRETIERAVGLARLSRFEREASVVARREAIEVAATPEGDGARTARGALAVVDNTVDPMTGTIRLLATFPNDDQALWPGQYVKVSLRLALEKDRVVVDARAVQDGQEGRFVYVVGDDGKATPANVEVGRVQGEVATITRGVEPGQTVVVDGAVRLRPGAQVKVVPPRKGASTASKGAEAAPDDEEPEAAQ